MAISFPASATPATGYSARCNKQIPIKKAAAARGFFCSAAPAFMGSGRPKAFPRGEAAMRGRWIFDRREKRRMRGRSLTSTTSSGASRHLPLIGEGTQARRIAFLHAADQKPSLGGRWRLSRRRRRRMREKKVTLPSKLCAITIPSSHSGCAAQSFPQGKPLL